MVSVLIEHACMKFILSFNIFKRLLFLKTRKYVSIDTSALKNLLTAYQQMLLTSNNLEVFTQTRRFIPTERTFLLLQVCVFC